MECMMLSVIKAGEVLGVRRTTIYKLIANNKLKTKKIGRRTLITVDSVKAFVDGEPR